MRQAGYNARGNGVGIGRHNDRNRRGRTLGGRNACRIGHQGLYVQTNQLVRQSAEAGGVSLGKAKLDLQVPAFDVTEVAEARPKWVTEANMLGGRRESKVSDPNNPLCLLRARGERTHDRGTTPTQNTEKFSPPHAPPPALRRRHPNGSIALHERGHRECAAWFLVRVAVLDQDIGASPTAWPCRDLSWRLRSQSSRDRASRAWFHFRNGFHFHINAGSAA